MRRAGAMLAVLAVGGCVATNSPEACRILPRAALPLGFVARRPVLDATIAGHPVRLVLDTGSNAAVLLTRGAFAHVGLARDFAAIAEEHGVGASMMLVVSQPATLRLGGTAQSVRVVAPDAALSGAQDTNGTDGTIGMAALSAYDLDIDLPARRLTLMAPRDCPAVPPLPAPASTIPATLVGERLAVPVLADGTRLEATIDTGATLTMFDAAALRLPPSELLLEKPIRIATLDPTGSTARLYRLDMLRIGTLTFRRWPAMVGDLSNVGADGVIGDELFRRHRIWLSVAGRSVTIAPAVRAPR